MADHRHGSSAQKMAETESRLFCSKNGRHRVTAGLLKKWQKKVTAGLIKKWQKKVTAGLIKKWQTQTDTHTDTQVSPLYSSEINLRKS